MNRIEVILFDLGNVILPFNHYQIAEKLLPFVQMREFRDPQKIFSYLFDWKSGAINSFDEGKLSPQEFFQSLKESLKLSISFDAFVPIWNRIFTEDREVSQIIRFLKGKYRLGLLSNTDPLHFGYIVSTFPVVSELEKWILSYEVGFKKPDSRIFQKAIEWASVEPERILLIDDTQGHVEAAVSLGMQGVHFISAQQLKMVLSNILHSPIDL
ncbi:MAG: HAD family phosphatase [Deltaproteobacteria bacterium]|nr:HAD family phosphatase [Deltaproteobacteria bacterium]MBM4324693.1 HAD family phosphatase [Deltaproteobacteria bacterium]